MAFNPEKTTEPDGARRKVFIIVGAVAVLLLAGLLWLTTRPASQGGGVVQLEGAIRPGDPEFERVRNLVILDNKEASEATRALGDVVMMLNATARNFTDRPLTGLEVRGSVVDAAGNPIKERTVIALPSANQTELGPNKTLPVRLMLEGFKQSDNRADYKMEITGIKFQ